MAEKNWSWGDDLDSFPAGMWDDFDGKIEILEYEAGDYGAQVHGMIFPEEYEWEARNMEPPEEGDDTGVPQFWWSMGGDEDKFTISNDGMAIKGGQPTSRTRAAKGMTGLVKASKIKIRSTDLGAFNDEAKPVIVHWKIQQESYYNREKGETMSSDVMYPVGPALGKAIINEPKAESGGRRGGRRGGRAAKAESEESHTEDNSTEEEEAPSTSRSRRGSGSNRASSSSNSRRTRSSSASTETTNEPEGEPESNGAVSEEDAFEIIKLIVTEAGGDGIPRKGFATALMSKEGEDGYSAEGIAAAAKRPVLPAAIKAGIIVEEDGNLFLPE